MDDITNTVVAGSMPLKPEDMFETVAEKTAADQHEPTEGDQKEVQPSHKLCMASMAEVRRMTHVVQDYITEMDPNFQCSETAKTSLNNAITLC